MFHTLESFDTEFSADSVEWCPIENCRDYFVCGTYQLTENSDKSDDISNEKSDTKRIGRIYLFQVTENEKLNLVQKLDTGAVLDMKWAPARWNNTILLGVVNSKGFLEIYEFVQNEDKFLLNLKSNVKVQEGLILSLDWSTGKDLMKNDASDVDLKVAVSDSKGFMSVFKIVNDGIERVFQSIKSHDFEAWIVAFNYWNTNILYTGGDDCKFQQFDLREAKYPTLLNQKHTAGVTSCHSNATREHLLATGSYDEILRTWDTRNLKRPLGETNLGGGIWRVKWEPFERRYLLAACMYDGFRTIDCQHSDAPNICSIYKEHQSIAYGCDWSMLTADDIKSLKIYEKMEHPTLIATCSFYDHVLKLSAVELTC